MDQAIPWTVNRDDVHILRGLFKRKREITQDPIMAKRRQLWTRHASLDSERGTPRSHANSRSRVPRQRPMILAETSGVLDELVPLSTLCCQEAWARKIERRLRDLIFRYEHVGDDWVVEPWIQCPWDVTIGSYGVETRFVRADNEGKLGSYTWDPPIKDLDRGLDQLHFRSLAVDRERTLAWKDMLEALFGDILPVRIRGAHWWTTGLTWSAIDLIGLQQLMLTMYDNPGGLHRLMAFLRDDLLDLFAAFEREGILSLNNEDDYVGSGSIGYTRELPQPGRQEDDPVRIADLWGLSESQETVGVSPQMFAEFVFPYQEPITRQFGLSYYGCCEPLHERIRLIKQLPNLRRVSVSPWCDQEVMADELGQAYIFCRKSNPSLISTAHFDENAIRQDLETTLRIAGHCPLELVMKDVHTLADQPWRLGRWVEIARQVCAAFGYT